MPESHPTPQELRDLKVSDLRQGPPLDNGLPAPTKFLLWVIVLCMAALLAGGTIWAVRGMIR